jgi:hypothetical protein
MHEKRQKLDKRGGYLLRGGGVATEGGGLMRGGYAGRWEVTRDKRQTQ